MIIHTIHAPYNAESTSWWRETMTRDHAPIELEAVFDDRSGHYTDQLQGADIILFDGCHRTSVALEMGRRIVLIPRWFDLPLDPYEPTGMGWRRSQSLTRYEFPDHLVTVGSPKREIWDALPSRVPVDLIIRDILNKRV